MKSTLRLPIIILLAAIGSVLNAADSAQIEAELKRIEMLNQALDAGGIAELLATALPCPLVHSKYYADKIAAREPELRQLEQAKRDFGLKLARTLDEVAAQLQQWSGSQERAKQAAQLVDLADWTKRAKGYGNYLLLSRCESLANVPLVHLTADLNFPIQNISSLRLRFMSEDEDRTFRVSVLNDEAERPFIGTLSGSISDKDGQIEMVWSKGWHAMAEWFKDHAIARDGWRRDLLPDELAFFFDDERRPEPLTTVNTWDLKRHGFIIFSNRDSQVRGADMLILFREKVGAFPTQPPKWWKPSDKLYSATEAAFENAWLPFEKQYGPIFDGAAHVYKRVTEGRFVDYETAMVRLAEVRKKTQAVKP